MYVGQKIKIEKPIFVFRTTFNMLRRQMRIFPYSITVTIETYGEYVTREWQKSMPHGVLATSVCLCQIKKLF